MGLQDRFSSVWYEGKQNHSESKKGPCVFELYAHVVAQQTVKIEQGDHVRKTCQKRTHCLNPTGFHSTHPFKMDRGWSMCILIF